MDPLITLFIVLAVLLLSGAHIGVAIGFAAFSAVLVGDVPFMLFTQKYYNSFESFPVLAVPFFILAGDIMSQGSMAKVLLNLSRTLVCHIRGGLAHISVLTCLFYGALCGAAPATTAAVGGMMIPAMKEEGYPATFATAVNSAGGALGPIIPPSIAVIVFGATAGISISDLFLAMIPGGLLIAIAFMGICYYLSAKHKWGLMQPRCQAEERLRALWEAKWAIMVPVIVLGGIYGGITTPTEAGVVACVYALGVETFVTRSMSMARLKTIMASSLKTIGAVFLIVCSANALGTMLTFYNADQIIAKWVCGITTNGTLLMVIFVIVWLIMGLFMEVVAGILMMTPVLLPIVKLAGIDPTHFGVVFVSTMVVGVITPPVGLNLYVGCGIGNVSFIGLCKDIVPFVVAMASVVLLIALIPQLCLFVL